MVKHKLATCPNKLMKKSDVNGDNTNDIYKYLKSEKAGILGLTRIKWNFEVCVSSIICLMVRIMCSHRILQKFLINRQGKVVERYASTTKPESIEAAVEKLL